jgi:MFS family permease
MQLSFKSSKAPFVTPFYYGWVIVAVSGLGIFFSSPGQTYSISMFINEYIRAFGWSRTFVSLLYSAATMLSGLLLFFMGRVIDRYGGRRMSMGVGVLLALTCFWNSLVATPVMLFIGFFFSRGGHRAHLPLHLHSR